MPAIQTTLTKANLNSTLLPVSTQLKNALINVLEQKCKNNTELHSDAKETTELTFNFRDKSYSATCGGFHPVEIALTQSSDDTWRFSYITDFSFIGDPFPELAKELDFDFVRKEWLSSYSGRYAPIQSSSSAKDLYRLWEKNFLSYLAMGMYDDIEVSVL